MLVFMLSCLKGYAGNRSGWRCVQGHHCSTNASSKWRTAHAQSNGLCDAEHVQCTALYTVLPEGLVWSWEQLEVDARTPLQRTCIMGLKDMHHRDEKQHIVSAMGLVQSCLEGSLEIGAGRGGCKETIAAYMHHQSENHATSK